MGFTQEPPRLGNQYRDDPLLGGWLERTLGAETLAAIEPELEEMGELAAGELYRLQLADLENEPRLVRWDAWGNRVDRIEPTAVWRRAATVAAERGLVALPYERSYGGASRAVQMALVYLFTASTDIYSCPLAMSDGAARALLDAGDRRLADRAVPRLVSRDPATAWTSGQWMTETRGGSDVGGTETVARRDEDGRYRLYGRKWFTSAASSEMALALARPEAGASGSHGLALFYLETRDAEGRLRGLRVERLKSKLGTRKLPTAELALEGCPAELVGGLEGGVRAIAPMLNVTRLWNAVSAIALMRRGLALATDYARRRRAFGRTLDRQPLHADTLAGLAAELQGAFCLTFEVAELLGRQEVGELDERGARLLRALTPIVKLTTAKQAVAVASECLECFGGAGYVEDTGLPTLLRDAQVLPIWEGTTNVLALDLLRALGPRGEGLRPIVALAERCREATRAAPLAAAAAASVEAIGHAAAWRERAAGRGRDRLEAGARRFALTLGRSLELALAARHAQWALDRGDPAPAAAAERLASEGVDRLDRFARGAVAPTDRPAAATAARQ